MCVSVWCVCVVCIYVCGVYVIHVCVFSSVHMQKPKQDVTPLQTDFLTGWLASEPSGSS